MTDFLVKGRTDLEAATAVEALLIAACEGVSKTDSQDDALFRQFRRAIRGRKDLDALIPKPVRTCRDLNAFWDYIKKFDPQWAPRRAHIRSEFSPLEDHLEDQASRTFAQRADSSTWTGRRSPEVQIRVVQSLVPSALSGVEQLLELLQAPLHNGGPRDEGLDEALGQLRLLHAELGELLRVVDRPNLAEEAIGRIATIRRRVFRWSAETYGLTVNGLPLAASSTIIACGVMGLLQVLTKGAVSPAESATIGAAAAGVVGIKRKS